MKKREIILTLLSATVPLSLASMSYAAVNAPLAVTGQKTCWNASGTVISCTGTGQDGELQKGVPLPAPRFVDNNDGTLTDTLTGLVWLKNVNCNPFAGTTWSGAISWARTLASGSCGLTDGSTAGQWRVPNVNELASLTDLNQPSMRNWLQGQGFLNVDTKAYCTSTTNANLPTQGWVVSVNNGGAVMPSMKSYGCGGVFVVRGGESGTFFPLSVTKDGHGTGTVTPDTGTITWTGNLGQGRYPIDSSVTLTASAESGSLFSGWSGACSGKEPCTLTMDAAKSVTATFGENGVCGSATNTTTTTAPTDNLCAVGVPTTPTWTGRYWSWSCNGYEGGEAPPCTTLPPPASTLTVSVSGSGTVHTTPPPDMNCRDNCSQNYDNGTVVTLTAVPSPANQYTFGGWSGACSGTEPCSLAMNESKTVGAYFKKDDVPPTPIVPGDMVVEATSPAGAMVTYTASAIDNLDPNPTVTCFPASGSTFPLGVTTVTCSARDAAGNPSNPDATFTIKVQDTTPPVLTLPKDMDVLLNTPITDQSVQDFLNGASAADIVDLTPAVSHSDLTALDTIGPRAVTFTATDHTGTPPNSTNGTANIHVVYGCGDAYLNGDQINYLPPVVDPPKAFKLGSTIPVKLHLCDGNVSDVTSAVVRLYVQRYSGDVPDGDPIDATSTSGADTGNYFRVAGNMYIYNLSTADLSAGTYHIEAVLNDGTMRSIPMALK